MDFFTKMGVAFTEGVITALSKPGVMEGLTKGFLESWRAYSSDTLIKADKPNQDDQDFIDASKRDGWVPE